jgi:hypothetical protein
MRKRTSLFLATATLAVLGAAGCTYDGGYSRAGPGGYAYGGGEWDGPRRAYEGDLEGPGLGVLDPWLKETPEGRAIVTLGFREAARGHVTEDVAHRANIWFRRYADQNRDMRITDPEIRTALVAAAARYMR